MNLLLNKTASAVTSLTTGGIRPTIGRLWPHTLIIAIIALACIALASYSLPVQAQDMDDATLSALTVSPKDITSFDADQDYYEVGFASTVTQATVTATPNNSSASVAITPADADSATGHQVNLSAGRNEVTITVTSQDGNEMEVYTLSLNRGGHGRLWLEGVR